MNNIAIVVIRSPQSLPENMVVYRVLSHKKICARGPTHHHNLAVAEKFGPSSPESIVAGLTVRKPDVYCDTLGSDGDVLQSVLEEMGFGHFTRVVVCEGVLVNHCCENWGAVWRTFR